MSPVVFFVPCVLPYVAARRTESRQSWRGRCLVYRSVAEVFREVWHSSSRRSASGIGEGQNGETLSNLAWAINGNFNLKNGRQFYKCGIHLLEYTRAVYQGLEKLIAKGLADGLTTVEIAALIRKQLDDWRVMLENGKQFWY